MSIINDDNYFVEGHRYETERLRERYVVPM